MNGPNPELLAAYGTDEVYLSNLEKRAADTIFGAQTRAISQGDFGRMLMGGRRDQARVDRFRAEADIMNQRFRALEHQVMANTIENMGGGGTRRSAFTRAMMTQPYAVHPLMYAGALGSPGGPMVPPAMMGSPPPEADLPDADLGAEMAHTASVSTAVAARLGLKLAHMSKVAQMGQYPAPSASGVMPYPPPQSTAPSIRQDFSQAGRELGAGAAHLGRGVTRSFGKAMETGGNLFGRLGRGVQDFMMSERRTTPRWGTGMAPAKDVNEYGVPIFG